MRQKTYAVNSEEENIIADGVEITIYGAITDFTCSENQITALDVSKNVELTTLDCHSNQLTSLDVSNNIALTELNCYSNQLTALDVSKNVALTKLSCGGNQLETLDVSKNTALTYLDCSQNKFTNFDLSKNNALNTLYCDGNKTITTLSVASAYGNGSISTVLAKIITNATSTTGTLNIYGGDNTTVHTAATTKGWTVNANL